MWATRCGERQNRVTGNACGNRQGNRERTQRGARNDEMQNPTANRNGTISKRAATIRECVGNVNGNRKRQRATQQEPVNGKRNWNGKRSVTIGG